MEKFLKLLHYLMKYERQELIYQKELYFICLMFSIAIWCNMHQDDLDDEARL